MKSLRPALALILIAVVAGFLAWGYRQFDRGATIPLIDRNDPVYADVLVHLDRRALFTLTGLPNRSLEDVSAERLQVVQQLSRARLSQAVYEASIARVQSRAGQAVRIEVDPYRWAGRKLERQVMHECSSRDDAEQQRRIRNFFMDFGTPRQVLTVTTRTEQIDGSPLAVYSIRHDFGGWNVIPMSVGSLLPASHLVLYAPFQQWFPVPDQQ
ncbi:hypothetical protein Verru16b_01014 [Lacunisphaera limnophila]|uniref:Uncharacterized protein n=1 Tax=Lacunisphaera limnophila TaxID=1838286 RepID=A0A1D8AST1_9BACT|nr:hypothetical protein [Lacunisphaera limnophila]AOS43954.1 hypothetical protein Verru16b_01014 [Lacunisphaera limnophila]